MNFSTGWLVPCLSTHFFCPKLRCWRWVFCHKRTTFLPRTEMQTVSVTVRWLESETTRTSLGSTVDGSTWGGLSFRWLESETTRTSLESMVCGSTWGGLSLRRLECETTRTSHGSIKDGSSWWGLSLTFAPAWGSSTSSPAGHQSSTCGEQRWGRSEGSCRWCPVPVLTTRLLMLSGLTGGNKTPKQHNTHYVQFTHYQDQMFSQCRRKTTEKHIHLLSQENTHTSSWNNNTCQR